VEFKQNIQPICLPSFAWNNKQLQSGTIAGWGFSERSDRSKVEEILRKTKINEPPSNEECFLRFRELVPLSSKRTFCAGGNNTGPCHGDSGEIFNFFCKFFSSIFCF
jgi:hypothetical protein